MATATKPDSVSVQREDTKDEPMVREIRHPRATNRGRDAEQSFDELLRDMHDDLAGRYKKQGAAMEIAWRSLGKRQRRVALFAAASYGYVCKGEDSPMWTIFNGFMHEVKVVDLVKAGSNAVLEIFKYRATRGLFEQYTGESPDIPGDRAAIEGLRSEWQYFRTGALSDDNASVYFAPNERYGEVVKAKPCDRDADIGDNPRASAGRPAYYVPYSIGSLVLVRQSIIHLFLRTLWDQILIASDKMEEDGATAVNKSARPEVSKLVISPLPHKMSLEGMVATAQDRGDTMEEFVTMMGTEPSILISLIHTSVNSHPGLVPDEYGRPLFIVCDKHISPAVFDSVRGAIKTAAHWQYLAGLLELLDNTASSQKASRAFILQEISNVCNFEFRRAQENFRRALWSRVGKAWFTRGSKDFDQNGDPRVTVKRAPESLERTDPQLYYALRLCRPRSNTSNAMVWLEKLGDLHQRRPKVRKRIEQDAATEFFEVALILGFSQDLADIVPKPPFSQKQNQVFGNKIQELDNELKRLRDQIDLQDFAAPLSHLDTPGMSEAAMRAVDDFVTQKMGAKMGLLYQRIVQDSLAELQKRCEQLRAEPTPTPTRQTDWLLMPPAESQRVAERVQERRQKPKTRPAYSPVSESFPPRTVHAEVIQEEVLPPPSGPLKVTATAGMVFSTLFDKSRSRGTINWSAFESAMADLGFSVIPKLGSAYTFYPPPSMDTNMPFTIHRPHQSRIEGHLILCLASRLKRVYGWNEATFEVS